MAYSKKELAAFLDGRNDPADFIPVLQRRLQDQKFAEKHEDYAEKLAQLGRVDKALAVLAGDE